VNILGEASGDWNITGTAATIVIGTTTSSWDLNATGYVARVIARTDLGGQINAADIGRVIARGEMNADIDLSEPSSAAIAPVLAPVAAISPFETLGDASLVQRLEAAGAAHYDMLEGAAHDVDPAGRDNRAPRPTDWLAEQLDAALPTDEPVELF